MSDVTLYHIPPSFYSQIARLVLSEKGVSWKEYLMPPGPPTFESYRPWYMKLNPMGTVPTLQHGDHVVPDTRQLAHYVEETFPGPQLLPDDEQARTEALRWLDAIEEISIRELSYGAPTSRRLGATMNRKRLRVLRKQQARHPEMKEIYERKIQDITLFMNNALDATHFDQMLKKTTSLLDQLEAQLQRQPWLAGNTYSLADTFWTVAVARFHMLDLDPLRGRPALAAWYQRAKARPSFQQAQIWETFQRITLLKTIARKYAPQLLLTLALVVGLGVLLWTMISP